MARTDENASTARQGSSGPSGMPMKDRLFLWRESRARPGPLVAAPSEATDAPSPFDGRERYAAPIPPPREVREKLEALQVALDMMAAPVIVLDLNGEILLANLRAEAELEPVSPGAGRFLTSDNPADGPGTSEWSFTPLGGASESIGFLAIRRAPPTEQALRAAVNAAGERWKLTARQEEVLDLVAHGLTNDLIAETLRIGKGTVEFHVSAIFDKAGVSNRTTLIVQVLAVGRP